MWHRIFAVISIAFIISCASLAPSSRAQQAAEVEEYLIDFSKNIEGRRILDERLPPDLDVEKFFAFLALDYSSKSYIERVREYPVKVYSDGESYILVLCDQDGKWILFKDLGRTTDKVDYPFGREGKMVPCQEKN
ncbi:MAG: hypothetical protein CVU57_23505 [Deltaproteobacteria bacterium HGW-Deltaproteobacteria-15]|jgi:hypothetical protein|nr:MAG: hypothetical protein CVU57_23505 [Deltaproteobacteria bacterium HGW-Deltaproteobacteria-15]